MTERDEMTVERALTFATTWVKWNAGDDTEDHGEIEHAFRALVSEANRLTARVAALEADQSDWRKGVALIASALGEPEPQNLSCVRLSEAILTLRAERDRLRAAVEITYTPRRDIEAKLERAYKLETQLEAAERHVELLSHAGNHGPACPAGTLNLGRGECLCGWSDALAEVER